MVTTSSTEAPNIEKWKIPEKGKIFNAIFLKCIKIVKILKFLTFKNDQMASLYFSQAQPWLIRHFKFLKDK